VAILLFGCGLVYLVHGWKVFKVLVVVNAAMFGGLLGNRFGQVLSGPNMPLFGTLAGGLLCAVLAWPLMKTAVSVMGAMVGGFLGFSMWTYAASAANRPALCEYAWAGGLIGLITLGLLAFVVFQLVVMTFTSIQGSLMTVSGLIAILMCLGPLRTKLHSSLVANRHLLLLLIGVPAVIGFAFQYSGMAKKAKKKHKAAEEG
jgi:hypothetical protein